MTITHHTYGYYNRLHHRTSSYAYCLASQYKHWSNNIDLRKPSTSFHTTVYYLENDFDIMQTTNYQKFICCKHKHKRKVTQRLICGKKTSLCGYCWQSLALGGKSHVHPNTLDKVGQPRNLFFILPLRDVSESRRPLTVVKNSAWMKPSLMFSYVVGTQQLFAQNIARGDLKGVG